MALLTENVALKPNLTGSASWHEEVYHLPIEEEASVEWKAISKVIKARDKNECKSCGIKIGLSVHHIKPRSDGGKDYPQNLITLCGNCHNEIEELNLTNKYQIIDFKRKRKYIKQPMRVAEGNAAKWQQWVYGGYSKP